MHGVDIEFIETVYHFTNPLLDQTMNTTLRTAWQEIIKLLIRPYSQLLDPEYFVIDSKSLYASINFRDPEDLVVSEDFRIPRYDLELSNLKQAELELLEDRAILKSSSINEIHLFNYIIISHFPTYHERDSSLKLSNIEDRVPISVLPTSYLRSIKVKLSEDYSSCIAKSCINEKIVVKPKVQPTPRRIEDYIRGTLNKMTSNCENDCFLKENFKINFNTVWDELLE